MHGLVGPRAILQTNSIEWWTPQRYVDMARSVMGDIDLDPASCAEANETICARQFFDRHTNGLTKEWRGRVWLNPPYGKDARAFVYRLLTEYENGRVTQAIALLNSNSVESIWFVPLRAFLLCFPRGRIHFMSPNATLTNATHGSVFVYMGRRKTAFTKKFSMIGDVFERVGLKPTA